MHEGKVGDWGKEELGRFAPLSVDDARRLSEKGRMSRAATRYKVRYDNLEFSPSPWDLMVDVGPRVLRG